MYMHFSYNGGEPYAVLDYHMSVNTLASDTELVNCVPSELSLTLEVPIADNPVEELFMSANTQHNGAEDSGHFILTVFKGKDVGESIQEIVINNGWITSLEIGGTSTGKSFSVRLVIAGGIVIVSGVNYIHAKRQSNFTPK